MFIKWFASFLLLANLLFNWKPFSMGNSASIIQLKCVNNLSFLWQFSRKRCFFFLSFSENNLITDDAMWSSLDLVIPMNIVCFFFFWYHFSKDDDDINTHIRHEHKHKLHTRKTKRILWKMKKEHEHLAACLLNEW